MPSELPPWCRVVAGDGPTLVIAPHGGLCSRDLLAAETAGALRGNDLHTADVAGCLAERLGGTLIANHALDRNELDLNRISEVTTSASWFLDLMHEQVERLLSRHAVAQVLMVHGWHVVQPSCDVGIGARLASAATASEVAHRLTVSAEYATSALEALRAATAEQGIRTTYGERWPAAHRNNVMQVFRRRRPAAAVPLAHPLGALAAAGRLQAVQLELGAPLRWPGAWRDRFLDAAARAFGDPAARRHGGALGERRPDQAIASSSSSERPSAARASAMVDVVERMQHEAAGGAAAATNATHAAASANAVDTNDADAAESTIPHRGVALQAFDANAGAHGLGIVAGIGALSPDEVGARLLLHPGGQRMLLFTGHERVRAGGAGRVGGLAIARRADGIDVRFRGPVLDLPDASDYFRREAAQLDATLVDLELDLRFTACGGAAFGRIMGEVRLDGRSLSIAAGGFTDPILGRPAQIGSAGSLRLTAAFGPALGLSVAADGTGATITRCTPDGAAIERGPAAAIPQLYGRRLPEPFALPLDGAAFLRCTPLGHVSIVRPTGEGAFARITFGAATFALDDGATGCGFYEFGTALASDAARNEDP